MDALEDPDDAPPTELAPTPAPTRVHRDGGFVLATAETPPSETTRVVGPLTLRYQGPHHYVIPVEGEFDDFEAEAIDEPEPLDVRMIDAQGHEWAIEGLDGEEAAAMGEDYRARIDDFDVLALEDGQTQWGEFDDLALDSPAVGLSKWTEFNCGSSSKSRFNFGTMSDLESMNTSQRRPILDTFNTGFSGTAVMIADDLALTAGHVASALVTGDQLCRRFSTSSTQCRSVESTVVSGNGGGGDDWGLIKFTSGFTGGLVYKLATGSDSFIASQTPRVAGYPVLRMNEESACGTSALLEGERNIGSFKWATHPVEVWLDITAGGGTSGAPYYFFNSTHGDYRVFGVHSQRLFDSGGDRFALGPKIPFWYPAIVASAAALGVTL